MKDMGIHRKSGFTLLEMIVSSGIFSLLAVAAIIILLALFRAETKASHTAAAVDNIRFSLELITKEMRTGHQYELSTHCGALGKEISFVASDGKGRVYYLSGGRIMRLRDSVDCDLEQPLTSEGVAVDRLLFDLRGALQGPDDGQPRITISMAVRVSGITDPLVSRMNLQTTIVQRFRDL